jgi:hypothetical protein
MPFIYHNKESDSYRLFGSLPILASKCNLEIKTLQYNFSRKKVTTYEDSQCKVVKVALERGGKQ